MVVSIIVWVLIGACIGWITSVLWKHPQGCVMDGIIAVLAMIAGAIIYGAIAGPGELLDLGVFSLLSGIVLAFIALAVARGWRTDVEARTVPPGEAEGWEPEDAPPAPTRHLREQVGDEETTSRDASADERPV
ncbi:MAG TPA: hypothetical protein DEP45_01830 [Armatimonadetes bacterium]|mgnify:CR=1 FL=1|nr:hypothetical protein [Armatimonadota bacterium]